MGLRFLPLTALSASMPRDLDLTTSHQTCFYLTRCSPGITLHPDLSPKTCILLSLKHTRVLIQCIYMLLYVVCTQLFYNKNVLNAQKWCGLTHHAFFQLFMCFKRYFYVCTIMHICRCHSPCKYTVVLE